jgi:hypothetical protein
MTIALFLLAAAGSCATPTLCPTAKDLISAIKVHTDEEIQGMYQQAQQGQNDFVTWAPRYIASVSDIICDDARSEGARSMNCKYTVHYDGDKSYQVATLVWQDGKWVITHNRAVLRPLAAAGQCAAPTLCPSHDELVQAVRASDAATVRSVANTISQDHPGDVVSVHAEPVRGISDMVCSDALTDAPRSMNCKFTLHYARRIVYRIGTFTWQDGRWVITNELGVEQKRR